MKKLTSIFLIIASLSFAFATEIQVFFSSEIRTDRSSRYRVTITDTRTPEYDLFNFSVKAIEGRDKDKAWKSDDEINPNFNPYAAIERDWTKLSQTFPRFDRVVRTQICKELTEQIISSRREKSLGDKRAGFQNEILKRPMGAFFKCEQEAIVALGFHLPSNYTIVSP